MISKEPHPGFNLEYAETSAKMDALYVSWRKAGLGSLLDALLQPDAYTKHRARLNKSAVHRKTGMSIKQIDDGMSVMRSIAAHELDSL